MKDDKILNYVLTEEDACRLIQLSQTLSRAIAELLESRCLESFEHPTTKWLADYQLNELSVYEQAHELRLTYPDENEY